MSHIPKILLSCGLSACVVVPNAYASPATGDTAQIVLVGSDQTTFYPPAGSSVKQYLQSMGVDYHLIRILVLTFLRHMRFAFFIAIPPLLSPLENSPCCVRPQPFPLIL